jgi:hypothetical protein
METHIRAVAYLMVALGITGLVFFPVVFAISDAWVAWKDVLDTGASPAHPVSSLILGFLAFHLGVLAPPMIASGVGLLAYREWARSLAIVCATLLLFGFPAGTAAGIYALWALLAYETELLFLRHPSRGSRGSGGS